MRFGMRLSRHLPKSVSAEKQRYDRFFYMIWRTSVFSLNIYLYPLTIPAVLADWVPAGFLLVLSQRLCYSV